jgi:hypothetical protein
VRDRRFHELGGAAQAQAAQFLDPQSVRFGLKQRVQRSIEGLLIWRLWLPHHCRKNGAQVKLYGRRGNAVARRFALIVDTASRFGPCVLPTRITLLTGSSSRAHVKAILASRKTASIASGTVPPRSQWKPLSKSGPHFGS